VPLSMAVSIGTCAGALLWLLWLLRRDSLSLGLPFAYLLSLLLIHLPGALAHFMGPDVLWDGELTRVGIGLTALGTVCFAGGVYVSRRPVVSVPRTNPANMQEFLMFCLIGGWLFAFGLGFLSAIPSVGAAVNKGSAVWMLAATLGLRMAVMRGDIKRAALWGGVMLIYPVVGLFRTGFLSYGSAAIIIIVAGVAISATRYWKVVGTLLIVGYLSLSAFVVYFAHRDDIRAQVWGGAPLEARLESVQRATSDLQWLDLRNPRHLEALDARLNQNFFVGLAANRIEDGDVSFLYGRSVSEGLLSLVPRVMWPEKPVFGGSPAIVGEMTGLRLSAAASFGVGNVMEFYINFGSIGVIVGFGVLGWAMGKLDRNAAIALRHGAFGSAMLFYLPAVAMIQPNGSLVEVCGGAGAAVIAGLGWRAAWNQWSGRPRRWARAVPVLRRGAPQRPKPPAVPGLRSEP
jgi:hypothetical protein